jgi:hypothetical protein
MFNSAMTVFLSALILDCRSRAENTRWPIPVGASDKISPTANFGGYPRARFFVPSARVNTGAQIALAQVSRTPTHDLRRVPQTAAENFRR